MDAGAGHDCPDDHQPDTTDEEPTGQDSKSDGAAVPGSKIKCTHWSHSSHVFIMTVEGDGESLSQAEYTSYQVSFIVNIEWPNIVYYDNTGFSVYVSRQHLAQAYAGQVFDSNFSPIKGASFDIAWLDESTFQVIVSFPGDEIKVTEMRTELDVYVSDADDNHVYDHRDVAIWSAQP